MAWRLRPAAIVSRWALVLGVGVALGHVVWALYGSGERMAMLDVHQVPEAAALDLSAAMSPLRVVLHAGYAPVGSSRLRYEAALDAPDGQRVWEATGRVGSGDDEASFVRQTMVLGTVEIAEPGVHRLSIRFGGSSMDDLREARLELRRNVAAVDPRVAWGGGMLAIGGLLGSLLIPRSGPTFEPALPRQREEEDRAAA